ncbi:MAG: Dihydrodipicolinate synthase family protein RL4423, partial [uncultured Acetobacteraceae bacterium]
AASGRERQGRLCHRADAFPGGRRAGRKQRGAHDGRLPGGGRLRPHDPRDHGRSAQTRRGGGAAFRVAGAPPRGRARAGDRRRLGARLRRHARPGAVVHGRRRRGRDGRPGIRPARRRRGALLHGAGGRGGGRRALGVAGLPAAHRRPHLARHGPPHGGGPSAGDGEGRGLARPRQDHRAPPLVGRGADAPLVHPRRQRRPVPAGGAGARRRRHHDRLRRAGDAGARPTPHRRRRPHGGPRPLRPAPAADPHGTPARPRPRRPQIRAAPPRHHRLRGAPRAGAEALGRNARGGGLAAGAPVPAGPGGAAV